MLHSLRWTVSWWDLTSPHQIYNMLRITHLTNSTYNTLRARQTMQVMLKACFILSKIQGKWEKWSLNCNYCSLLLLLDLLSEAVWTAWACHYSCWGVQSYRTTSDPRCVHQCCQRHWNCYFIWKQVALLCLSSISSRWKLTQGIFLKLFSDTCNN